MKKLLTVLISIVIISCNVHETHDNNVETMIPDSTVVDSIIVDSIIVDTNVIVSLTDTASNE